MQGLQHSAFGAGIALRIRITGDIAGFAEHSGNILCIFFCAIADPYDGSII